MVSCKLSSFLFLKERQTPLSNSESVNVTINAIIRFLNWVGFIKKCQALIDLEIQRALRASIFAWKHVFLYTCLHWLFSNCVNYLMYFSTESNCSFSLRFFSVYSRSFSSCKF